MEKRRINDITVQDEYYDFYGVVDNYMKLGNLYFGGLCDEDDGYRSYMDDIYLEPEIDNKFITKFTNHPLTQLRDEWVESYSDGEEYSDIYSFNGFLFKDKDERTWIAVGTNNSDDYYPWYVFRYTPFGEEKPFTKSSPEIKHPELFI